MGKSLGLYIHIPFCKAKCHYCDFNSYAGISELMPAYFNALKTEMEHYGDRLKGDTVRTVFIGGGTPSLANPHEIDELMDVCRHSFHLKDDAEISIETNPGTLSYEKVTAYRTMGINRLSIGLQAWQNGLLKGMGRIHSQEEFVENYMQARKAGFENINVDLIFGLPGQTFQDWHETLQQVVKLEPEHLSCYSLKIEEDTLFGQRLNSGELVPIEDELDREMYYETVEILKKSGYKHYEISNFARPGFECRHNMIYWKAEEYVGVGAGAHSYLEGKRFHNIQNVRKYISTALDEGVHREDIEEININEQMSEFVILGLRLIDGIRNDDFYKRFGADIFDIYGKQIHKLVTKNLLHVGDGGINLTPLGLDLANEVFVEFI